MTKTPSAPNAAATAATALTQYASGFDETLDRAELRFRGQVPDDPTTHRRETKDWLDDKPLEHGGPKGPEPTRFGDWERAGRCFDF